MDQDPPPPPNGQPPHGTDAQVSSDEQMLAMLAHVLGLFTGVIAPIILYFVKKDDSKFVAFHSLQALGFQLVIFAAYVIAWFLGCVLIVGVFLLPIVCLLDIAVAIMFGLKAKEGEWAEIPVIGDWARGAVEH